MNTTVTKASLSQCIIVVSPFVMMASFYAEVTTAVFSAVAKTYKQLRRVTLLDGKQYAKFKQRHLRTGGGVGLSSLIYVALVLTRLPLSVLTSLGKS